LSPYKYVYTISYQYNHFHIPTWYQTRFRFFSLPPRAATGCPNTSRHPRPAAAPGGRDPPGAAPFQPLPPLLCSPPPAAATRRRERPLLAAFGPAPNLRRQPLAGAALAFPSRGASAVVRLAPNRRSGSPPPHARLPSADGHGPLGGSNHGGAHAGPAAGLDPPAAALMAADAAPPLLRPPAPTPPCSWARPSSPSPWAPSPSSSVLLCAAAAILAAGVPPPSRTRRRRPSSTHLAAWSPISPVQPAVCNLPLRQRGHACSSRRGLVGTRTAAATGRRGAAGALVPNHRRPFLLSSSRWPSPNCLR
jgi:hypothetical protein